MAYNQSKNPFSKNPLNFNSPLNSFDSLVGKLMNQGKSKEAATKIAGKVANMKMKGAGSGPTAKQKARAKGSAAKMDHSPAEMGHSPAEMDHSPAEMEDLSGDGKITKKDVLIGRGVIDKDGSPAKMKSPMEAHDKKLKALEKRIKRVRQSKEGSEGQGGIDYELLAELEEQKKRLIEAHGKEAKDGNAKPSPANIIEGEDPDETKTEKLDEVVVTASPDRSREGNKARKAKMKREGKSKREIRLAKTKAKALAAKKATVDAKDKDSQKLARAKANRLAKRAARQEGRAERRKIRKSNKFRENKEKEIIASRRKQQEKGAKGASALAMKSPMKKDGEKADLLSRAGKIVKKGAKKYVDTHLLNPKNINKGRKAINKGIKNAGKKVKKLAEGVAEFAKDTQKRAT